MLRQFPCLALVLSLVCTGHSNATCTILCQNPSKDTPRYTHPPERESHPGSVFLSIAISSRPCICVHHQSTSR